jgi:hypothetical protein
LSGIVMIDAKALGRQVGTGLDGTAAGRLAADVIGDGVLGEPAIKIFKPGTEVVYTCEVYDGRETREVGFSTQARILRDGTAIYTSPPAPISGASEPAPVGAVRVGGVVQLGRGLPPGTYTLQVSVSAASGKGRARQASQWVDFEVRR